MGLLMLDGCIMAINTYLQSDPCLGHKLILYIVEAGCLASRIGWMFMCCGNADVVFLFITEPVVWLSGLCGQQQTSWFSVCLSREGVSCFS